MEGRIWETVGDVMGLGINIILRALIASPPLASLRFPRKPAGVSRWARWGVSPLGLRSERRGGVSGLAPGGVGVVGVVHERGGGGR